MVRFINDDQVWRCDIGSPCQRLHRCHLQRMPRHLRETGCYYANRNVWRVFVQRINQVGEPIHVYGLKIEYGCLSVLPSRAISPATTDLPEPVGHTNTALPARRIASRQSSTAISW